MKKIVGALLFTFLLCLLMTSGFCTLAAEPVNLSFDFEKVNSDEELQKMFGSYYKNASVSLVTENGNKAMKVVQEKNYANATLLTDVSLQLDKTYLLQFDIKVIGETESGAAIDKDDVHTDIMFKDSKGIGSISHIAGKVSGGSTSGWLHYSGNYTLSKAALGEDALADNTFGAAKMSFYANPVGSKPITFYVDNIVFKEVEKPLTILVFGNSILNHGINEELGWFGQWGMAASAEDKDYFHLLKDKLVGDQFGEISWIRSGASTTERSLVAEDNYDYTALFETNLNGVVRTNNPDVIIIQLGENVAVPGITASQYENALTQMAAGFLKINPNVKIIFSTGFWGGAAKVAGAKAAAEKTGFPCADLSTLNTSANKATGLFANNGVAMHPGDLGMANIAKLFYEKLEPILSEIYTEKHYPKETPRFAVIRDYAPSVFADVAEADWFYGSVADVYRLGLMNGKSEGSFDPNGQMTIAEAITIAVRINDIYAGTASDTSVAAGEKWYAGFVKAAVAKGILDDAASYQFDAPVTRAIMCELFAKALPADYLNAINSFTAIPDLAKEQSSFVSVLLFYNAGIVTGVDAEYHFNPDNNIKRSEAAAIITRIADKTKRLKVA